MKLAVDWTCRNCGATGHSEPEEYVDHVCDSEPVNSVRFVAIVRKLDHEPWKRVETSLVVQYADSYAERQLACGDPVDALRSLANEIERRGFNIPAEDS